MAWLALLNRDKGNLVAALGYAEQCDNSLRMIEMSTSSLMNSGASPWIVHCGSDAGHPPDWPQTEPSDVDQSDPAPCDRQRCAEKGLEPMKAIKRMFILEAIGIALLVLGHCTDAIAQAEDAPGGQSLEQAASDPTASLMSVQIQDVYAGDYYGLDDESSNTVLLRVGVPFQAGRLSNMLRATLPVVTDSPSGEDGLGDLTVLDLIVFDRSWGRWGIGPVMSVPTGTDQLSSEQWAIGPAIGFVTRSDKHLWGVFNQNLFTLAGDDDREEVNVSFIQPIVNFALPNKWSIGTSEMNFTYDWERNAWTVLPLGVKVAKLARFGRLPVQLSGAYEYNFADDYVAPKWSVNFTAKFLFPL